jgi:hypothetical protein
VTVHPPPLRLVVVEAPFSGLEIYKSYLAAVLRDCFARGEAPYPARAISLLALDDRIPSERALSSRAGDAWRAHAAATVVYTDFGVSPIMQVGILNATAIGIPVERRQLGGLWAEMYERFQDESARKPIAPASGR